jgi:hypothetical protein
MQAKVARWREHLGAHILQRRRALHWLIRREAPNHANALGALADIDEPVLVAVDERPEQDAPDEPEDGGVGADAEGQREHDGEGQTLGSGEGPQGELEIDKKARGLKNPSPVSERMPPLTIAPARQIYSTAHPAGMLESEGVPPYRFVERGGARSI